MKFFKFYANASSTPPAPMPNPSYGYPSNGDIAAGIPPTILGAEWVYNLGMEMTALIELGGMEPSDENLHQLADFFVNFKAAMEDLQRQAASGAGTATELSQNMAQIRTDAEAARDAAISAKNTAVSSASAAEASETAAAGSATTATQKANAAASSASAAKTSETNAAGSAASALSAKNAAVNAQTAAEQARDDAVAMADTLQHPVSYAPQTLTAEQKNQALENLGITTALKELIVEFGGTVP